MTVHAAFDRQLYDQSGVYHFHNFLMPHMYGCLASRLSADCLDELSEIRSLFTKPQSRLRMGGGSAQQRTGSGLVQGWVCKFALRQEILSWVSQFTCTPWMRLSEPSGASLEAEKEQWDKGASREQKHKMTTHGVPMAFERLIWKASAVLHFTHRHWQLTHHRRNDHLAERALLDGKDGATSWCDSPVYAAALSSIGLYWRCQEKQTFLQTFCGWASPCLRVRLPARRKIGKAPAWLSTAPLRHGLDDNCASQWEPVSHHGLNWGNCPNIPILETALASKTNWLLIPSL